MKRRIDFVKYIIRLTGVLFILAAMAVFCFSEVVQIDGVKSKDFRTTYTLFEDISAAEEAWLLEVVNNSDSEEREDLKDNDLPYKKSEVKAWFRNLNSVVKEALNRSISLEEVVVLAWNAQRLVNDAENLMETDYILDGAADVLVEYAPHVFVHDVVCETIENAEEYYALIRNGCYIVVCATALLAVLTLAAVIGNMCNRGRWGKYVLLGAIAGMTAGGYYGLQKVSELAGTVFADFAWLENFEVHMTSMPLFAIALLLVPLVLDIWDRKRAKKVIPVEKMSVAETKQVQTCVDTEVEGKRELSETVAGQPAENYDVAVTAEDTALEVSAKKAAKKAARKCRFHKVKMAILKVLRNKIVIAVGATVITAVAVLLIILQLSNTYKTPVRVMERISNNQKYAAQYIRRLDLLNGLLKDEQKALLEILENSEEYQDMIEDQKDDFEEELEDLIDEYGKNYKYSFKIVEKETLEREDLKKFRKELRNISDACKELEKATDDLDSDDWEELSDEMDLSKSQTKALFRLLTDMGKVCKNAEVSDGYELTVEITLTGSELDEPEEDEMSVYVYKVNGRWITSEGLSVINLLIRQFS